MGKRARARREAADRKAEADILDWFRQLNMIPTPSDVALRRTGEGCIEIPVREATDDDLVLLGVDNDYAPTIEDVAAGCVSSVRRAEERFPSRWHPYRWPLTGWVSTKLYVLGITASGGSVSFGGDRPVIYRPPRLRSVFHGRRCYVLGKPMWWWECHARQGLTLRGRHKPERPYCLGICAACLPCPYCGQHYGCRDDCEAMVPA